MIAEITRDIIEVDTSVNGQSISIGNAINLFFIFASIGGAMYVVVRESRYGCLSFIGDVFMTFVTGGLWLIWIFVREMRRNR
jgi:hypothetical protein